MDLYQQGESNVTTRLVPGSNSHYTKLKVHHDDVHLSNTVLLLL